MGFKTIPGVIYLEFLKKIPESLFKGTLPYKQFTAGKSYFL